VGRQNRCIMQTGRFKVFKHLADGRVHKEGDDLMSATRYALMMLRYAHTAMPRKPRSYPICVGGYGWMYK